MIDRRGLLAAGLAGTSALPGLAAAAARMGGFGPRDLAGTWDLGSYTEIERPAGFGGLVATPAEAEAYEAPRRKLGGMLPGKPGEVGQAENEFLDRGTGLARVKGELRSSWIVDPPDGKIPYTPAAQALAGTGGPGAPASAGGGLDNPEEMGGTTRCLATVAAGAPIFAAPDSNIVQTLLTRDHFAIQSEKYHDVRIVRLVADARALAAAPRDPQGWLGCSVGCWEGDALRVETTGFHPGVINRGQRILTSGATRVSERFSRLPTGELLYAFSVEDPDLLTRPWRGEMAFRISRGALFEYACHEGNYSMAGMLAGARREEREKAK
ncbi:hypothetical protein [Phenylobacterium sp.]|uniref:hypothetical protein n=1 Tax=Phenylobacterium sp. TaxID=1871053 RepID=UPI003563CB14